MDLKWIYLAFALSLSSVTTFPNFDVLSFHSPMIHRDGNRLGSSLSRLKRAAAGGNPSVSQYTVDIEISFPNASLLEDIKKFIRSLTYPIIANNSSSSLNITGIDITTACSQSGSNLQCTCENGYEWSSGVCHTYLPCSNSSNSLCTCIGQIPPVGLYCQTKQSVNVQMNLKIEEPFTDDFNNPASEKYNKYKNQLESSFNAYYGNIPGFRAVYVTGFRPGSVVVEYTLVTDPTNTSVIQSVNDGLVANLSKSFNLSSSPFQNVIQGVSSMTVNPTTQFVGDNLTIVCSLTSTFTNVAWYFNGTQKLTSGGQYVIVSASQSSGSTSNLTIINLTLGNTGNYRCIFDNNSNTFPVEQNISISSLYMTDITINPINCDNSENTLAECCTNGDINSLKLTCSPNVNNAARGTVKKSSDLTSISYVIQALPEKCVNKQSATYTCDCSTGNGAKVTKSVSVSYVSDAKLALNSRGSTYSILEGQTIWLECTASMDITDITWYFASSSINTALSGYNSANTQYNPLNKTSVLSIANANPTWRGNFYCASQEQSLVSGQQAVNVVRLIPSAQLQVSPLNSFYSCGDDIPFSCCLLDTINYDLTNYSAVLQTTGPSISPGSIICNTTRGVGEIGAVIKVPCSDEDSRLTGTRVYRCSDTRDWVLDQDNCVLATLQRLNLQVVDLSSPVGQASLPTFVSNLTNAVTDQKDNVSSSSSNIQTVVTILQQVQSNVQSVPPAVMVNILTTINVVVDAQSTSAWTNMANKTENSKNLLESVENFAKKLQITSDKPIELKNNSNVQLAGSVVTSAISYDQGFSFSQGKSLSGSVLIDKNILSGFKANTTVVTIAYATLGDILANTTTETLNGVVMSTVASNQVPEQFNILMKFTKGNKTLNVPNCVFWNLTTLNWDNSGCRSKDMSNDSVTCSCDHLTSFSILMSYKGVSSPALEYITYIGLSISIISLVICIMIEVMIWKSVTKNKTSYMRHICLVNIALSLLLADIWFIIGSAMTAVLEKNESNIVTTNACVAATFFTHLLYLSLFFWMLTMGLILFYRLVFVFHDISKSNMMAVAFGIGYGCPLLIAIITVAVTQPSKTYTKGIVCWLNFDQSKAFIAFILPALTIIVVNFIFLAVVIIKILRPTVGDKPKKEDKSTLIHVGKSIAILTPLLGLTWGFGIGTIVSEDLWIHGVFAFLNAFQIYIAPTSAIALTVTMVLIRTANN
ncbi:hypothetical protein GDO86_010509 [Hymenochirus boettgeri]|uniref:Adhesion G protein-coupled receptor F5 n=1 Tax=Hymenochirus boettgeri TaxID=247094 RepID=A0A8T2JTR0_9PIPI|nr:hypothetical protein GDO86_010509 [Hymenochirus boettgeri]